jgi:hypothetical protein
MSLRTIKGWRGRSAVLTLGLAVLAVACSGTTTNTTGTPSTVNASTSSTAATGSNGSTGTAPGGSTGSAGTAKPKPSTEIPARFKDATSEMYTKDANWLCRPALANDHCTTDPIDATVIKADGTTAPEARKVAKDAKVDCFYVYPTVNLAPGGGNKTDLTSLGLELVVTDQQAARFADVCNLYVPLYRQMNLSAYSSPPAERDKAEALAYGDVHDAFAYYMGHFNEGRPIVLIGHSQGSGHLMHLMQDEFDKDEVMRSKLVSALLIGGSVQVAEGKDVGGSFSNIPLCRSNTQLGCVIAYNSFGVDPPPGADDFFGRAEGGLVAGCTNPAALAGGKGTLKPYVPPSPETGKIAKVDTNFVALPDALTGECVTADGQTYLAIAAAKKPGDTRDLTTTVTNVPGWGLHLTEVNLTQGNLLDLVRDEIAALG